MTIDLATLRPTGESADDIAEALTRIAAARAEAEATLIKARADREKLLIEGSPKAIRASEQEAHDAALTIERLALIEAKIEPTLAAARQREAQAARDAAVAALEAEIEASDARWNSELQQHVQAIADLVAERQELAQRARVLKLNNHAALLLQGTDWTPASNAQIRHERAEADARRAAEANERLYAERAAQREFWNRDREERGKQFREEQAKLTAAERDRRGYVGAMAI